MNMPASLILPVDALDWRNAEGGGDLMVVVHQRIWCAAVVNTGQLVIPQSGIAQINRTGVRTS
jgi:hypothetical protein